jgi:hypothetical protein
VADTEIDVCRRPSAGGTSGSLVQAIDVRRGSLSTLFRGVASFGGGVEVIQRAIDGRYKVQVLWGSGSGR